MDKFTTLEGIAAPLPQANVDTDQIIPKQFLATVERAGLGKGLFFDMRFDTEGKLKPDFVLNQAAYQGAAVLIAGPNFGCGSSREHAPWALSDFGIRCVIAASFADIFFNNCFKNGVLPLVLPQADVDLLIAEAGGGNHKFTIDLAAQTVISPSGKSMRFEIDQGRKAAMMAGLDEIGETLVHSDAIAAHEAQKRANTPWAA